MAMNEKRIVYMARTMAEKVGADWDELPAMQQYLVLEQARAWEQVSQEFNAKHNIVEAEVSDSIFGIGKDADE